AKSSKKSSSPDGNIRLVRVKQKWRKSASNVEDVSLEVGEHQERNCFQGVNHRWLLPVMG
ncbi:hypothetical protein AVEN_218398-1, partial [Araneus ventricosus]